MLPSSVRTAAVALPAGGELAKALIINTTTGETHQVMYNPEELKLEQGNNFAEVGIPGLDTPPCSTSAGRHGRCP